MVAEQSGQLLSSPQMSATSATSAVAVSTAAHDDDLLPSVEKKPTPLPAVAPLSWLEVLPTGTHGIIGSFVGGRDVGNLSLASRWCLETFVEQGVSTVTINAFPDEATMPKRHCAMYLAAFLRRRQRLKNLTVNSAYPSLVSEPLALAFAAGCCHHLETLQWDVGDNMGIVASAIAMNSLPCLKILILDNSPEVDASLASLATGGSPLLEYMEVAVMEKKELLGVVAALESRSRHKACVPLREFSIFQFADDEEVLNRLFACRMLASVDYFLLGGHGPGWLKALVLYLQRGLEEGSPRGVRHIEAGFSGDFPDGDAELLMDVLARGGAPELEMLSGFCEGRWGAVYWSPQAQWLFLNAVTGKKGACPKLKATCFQNYWKREQTRLEEEKADKGHFVCRAGLRRRKGG